MKSLLTDLDTTFAQRKNFSWRDRVLLRIIIRLMVPLSTDAELWLLKMMNMSKEANDMLGDKIDFSRI